jgi:hypothetical protein
MSGQKYSHIPLSFINRGPAGQQWLENEKAPSVTGGAQKIPVRSGQRTRKLFGSPAQGGPNRHGAPHGRLIETEHDDHPKVFPAVRHSRALKRDPLTGWRALVNSILWPARLSRSRGRPQATRAATSALGSGRVTQPGSICRTCEVGTVISAMPSITDIGGSKLFEGRAGVTLVKPSGEVS